MKPMARTGRQGDPHLFLEGERRQLHRRKMDRGGSGRRDKIGCGPAGSARDRPASRWTRRPPRRLQSRQQGRSSRSSVTGRSRGMGKIRLGAAALGASPRSPALRFRRGRSGARRRHRVALQAGARRQPVHDRSEHDRLAPTGEILGETPVRRKKPKVDCFYVYPTVSDDPGINSDREAGPEERSIALYQAARYAGTAVSTPRCTGRSRSRASSRASRSAPRSATSPTATSSTPGRPTCATTTTAAEWS